MWLNLTEKAALEQALFHILVSAGDGASREFRPILTDHDTLEQVFTRPHPKLLDAMGLFMEKFFRELDYNHGRPVALRVPPSLPGLVLGAHNALTSSGVKASNVPDPVAEFTDALIATRPPARDRDTALAYHAILRVWLKGLYAMAPAQDGPMGMLMELSPLTALATLDLYTPRALNSLADELLAGWQAPERTGQGIWGDEKAWIDMVALLVSEKSFARWVRNRWLAMPETRPACRNMGLVLEALRRRGDCRDFILEFYESYDYFRAETALVEPRRTKRCWPVLGTIEKLLRVPGDNEAAIRLNRRGNEYFLKFRPLVEIILSEKVTPPDFKHLTTEFVGNVRPLLNFITENKGKRMAFGEIAFGES